jgi:hypothetical protein
MNIIAPLSILIFYAKMVSRSIYNLKIDTIYMYDIPIDRSFLRLSNGITHVMPSTDTKPELTAKASMAQPVSAGCVCQWVTTCISTSVMIYKQVVNQDDV